jgi:ABC-2 type transport system ATP-binding protein
MIKVENLTQTYRSGKGIFDLSFTINKGEVFGYLGPNGAGKTTTIRNLLGFANADRGNARIREFDCRKQAAEIQKFTGYLPGEIAFFDNMTGIQFLKFIGEMRKTKDMSLRNSLIDRLELETDVKIRRMSKGMKQKLGIVTAFMHNPEVYILDEPTSGLDPLMQNTFLEMIAEEKEKGKTIMMSSHIFEEVQISCDRAGIIREGKLAAIEDIKSLKEMKQKNFIVTVSSVSDTGKIEKSSLDSEKLSDNKILVRVQDNYSVFFKLLSGCSVKNLEIKQQSLEDIFMKYYGKEGRNNE